MTAAHACPYTIVRMGPTNNASWSAVGADDTYHYSATVLSVFWPETEHQKLLARWPHLAAEVGTTWDEHRQQIERHCALVSRAGHGVNQTPGDVSGFEAFLQDKHINHPASEDLRGYPDLRTQPAMVPWPPARTAACWCDSGRKYKQCCRPHGLGTLD
ncbi:MAG TPA: SEC-C domain-containing protein [Amycolatopsis sp.]|uniref:SEC-C domain-containing protein n=1 Tax=Amycolatopsis sp. TaxID=37632 RepID=UPI002B4942AD|nr:SEC-C domain-containing protein [Amycolatopsis sp.]HKS44451.1 SEC-C domain-containing protein [Amycolatopsis sp.]